MLDNNKIKQKARKNAIVEYLDHYSAKETKERWRYASSKARLECATYPRSLYIWLCWQCGRGKLFLDQSIRIDETLWAFKWAWQTFFGSIDR